jgi:hypothetical protein
MKFVLFLEMSQTLKGHFPVPECYRLWRYGITQRKLPIMKKDAWY